MHEPLLPSHRSDACTGTWLRHVVSNQAIWQCTRCGFAYPESLPVLGAVRTEGMIADLLSELAAAGTEILTRQREGEPG
jgi:hypothetical protein